MSLLNVWLTEDRAYVGADTASMIHTGEFSDRTKLIPMGHASLVIAGRGDVTFLYRFAAFWPGKPGLSNFDTMADHGEEVANAVFTMHVREFQAAGLGTSGLLNGAQQIVVAGWSPRAGRMAAVAIERIEGSSTFQTTTIESVMAGPELEVKRSVIDAYDWMLALAEAQVLHCREKYPGQPVGGQLLVAEIQRRAISIRDMGKLG